ncbi:hypothetical protein [Streptomyces antarcticus]|uniref:hypothetical protein n=1 Tax=Streptomyces antarcticus TaxID=2996458 RepID=UPI00226F9CC0|nr:MULTISPECIES: hypothetical protein [unclassified Streptomyces]MCY0940202.1 hypothetical protein [Streptomyces sp. H34-AA3]MCZ4080849.1 hypothetical protein [Streptomyces sp. H34-S5]
MEEGAWMVSLVEELEAREVAARARVEELRERIAELTVRLEAEREAWSRLVIARETVAEVVADLPDVELPGVASVARAEPLISDARVIGAMTVPHWRQGMTAEVLPGVYRDIVEVVADAPGPVQAKQIVPRIGLPVQTGKIEGTRGKLKRLVQRGWLTEQVPGQFAFPHHGAGPGSVNSR